MTEQALTRPTTALVNPPPAVFVQRKCACGAAPRMSGACDECRESQLRRKPATMNSFDIASEGVNEVLRAPGQPLDANRGAPAIGRQISQAVQRSLFEPSTGATEAKNSKR
jgi:hypothetical protein